MSTDKETDEACSKDSKESQDGPNQVVLTHKLELEQLKNEIQRLTTANHNLWAINQLMQTQVKIAMQPFGDMNRELTAKGVGHIDIDTGNASSSSSSSAIAMPVDGLQSKYFPDVVLQQIFRHVTDTKTLLSCRRVSKMWKTEIDNTPALMKRLTFKILHPALFMELTNITPGVRSVKFDYACPFTDGQLGNMVKKIADTLESVTFDFDYQWNDDWGAKRDQIRKLVTVILSRCANLTELRVVGTVKGFMAGLIVPSNITSLIMDVKNKASWDQTVYEEIIQGLHKLTSLTLFNSADQDADADETFDFVPVLSPVCEHMLKYPGVLKKFTYKADHGPYWFDATSAGQKLWTKLYLIAGTHNVVINTSIVFNLENLLLFDQSYPVTVQSCSAITKVRHLYHPTRTNPALAHFERIQCCRNLQEIHISVLDDIHDQLTSPVPNELNYLWWLNNLQSLSLTKTSGSLSKSNFATPLSAVRLLKIFGVVFDSTSIYSSISVYFPNLVDLVLISTTVPDDLFSSLARLEGLANLKLKYLSTLTDSMFLSPQASTTEIPAIAQFASLKHLKITCCENLTDKCLLYGIRFISTLLSFTVANCSGITEAGLAEITHGRFNMNTTVEQHEFGTTVYTLSSTGF